MNLKWFGWLLLSFVFIGLGFVAYFAIAQQNGNEKTTEEVKTSLKSINLGSAREEGEGTISKKDEVANLVLDVVKAQKNNGKDIDIHYVFFDKNGQTTQDEAKITSVQFLIQLKNEAGDVVSEAAERLSLKEAS